jgi:hypothetical protein
MARLESPPRSSPGSQSLKSLLSLVSIGAGGRKVLRLLVPDTCAKACERCPFAPTPASGAAAGLAWAALGIYRSGACDGLFLTVGLAADPVGAMKRLLEMVELLRFRFGYRGYLHAKAVAGAEPGQIERLMRLVDRVSVRLEPACQMALDGGAPADVADVADVTDVAKLGNAGNKANVDRVVNIMNGARVASARRSPPLLPVRARVASPAWPGGPASESAEGQAWLFEPTRPRASSYATKDGG